MGYWNGWRNYKEWACFSGKTVECKHCGCNFTPSNAIQKLCTYEDNSSCYSERSYNSLTLNQWIRLHGQTVKEFIVENGIEFYNSLK